jgi:hypothetical protein
MQGGNKGQEKHIACEIFISIGAAGVKKFENKGIRGVGSVSRGATGAKMIGKRKGSRKLAQQGTRSCESLVFKF